MHRWVLVLLFFQTLTINVNSQTLWIGFKEDLLKGRIKQIEEFISRFNFEETWDGKVIKDKSNLEYRKKNIRSLFDYDKYRNNDDSFSPTVEKFARFVVDNNYTLHYEDSTWTAIVKCNATICEKNESLTLYLQTKQQTEKEYFWVIKDVTGNIFSSLSENDDNKKNRLFISPMEHEIGFIGILDKPYQGADMKRMIANSYTSSRLSMLAILMEAGLLKLKTIQHVSFTFSSVPGWFFTVSRKEKKDSYNTGWLITNITETETETNTTIQNNK